MNRSRLLLPLVAAILGCGGAPATNRPPGADRPQSPPASEPAPPNDVTAATRPPQPPNRGPAWSVEGDRENADGFRFICSGEGKTADEAASTARALCEDKICKLCGVEIESVVQSKETLTGVEMSREVIERCRRVRTEPAKVLRQSLDCPSADRCTAWIEIDYPRDRRDRECKALTQENFADPALCESLIEEFHGTRGYTAASFRARADLLRRAVNACKDIDVRPTPLLTALDQRLREGMSTFVDERGRAPRYLSRHWLAPHAPMWNAYGKTKTFEGRISLLLKYVSSKVPVLDVIEAANQPPEILDTKDGFSKLIALLKKAPTDHGFGVSAVHFYALDRVRQHDRRRLFSRAPKPLWDVLIARYGPDAAAKWNRLTGLMWLAAADGVVSDAEWRFFMKVPGWWARSAQILLAADNHGSDAARQQRFKQALARSIEERGPTARAAKRILPRSPFVLDVEPMLPEDARRELYTFDKLQDTFRRLEDDLSTANRQRFLTRLQRAAGQIPTEPKKARRSCNQLSKRLEFLEERNVQTQADGVICRCLVEHLKTEGMSLISKSALYERALDRRLPCVSEDRGANL